MQPINPEEFFDVNSFPYPQLFCLEEPVWEAISDLPDFVGRLFACGRDAPQA